MPLYLAVKQDIEKRISNGEFSTGDRLPTEKELCEYYSVSRITTQKACNLLVGEGTIYRIQGKGSFVKKIPHISTKPSADITPKLTCSLPGVLCRYFSTPSFQKAFAKEFPNVKLVLRDAAQAIESCDLDRFSGADIFWLSRNEYRQAKRYGLLGEWRQLLGRQDYDALIEDIPESLVEAVGQAPLRHLLPFAYCPVSLVFNSNLLEASGISIDDGKWDKKRFTETCLLIKEASATPRTIPFLCEQSNEKRWPFLIYSNGGKIWSQDGTQCLIDSDEALRGFDFIRHLTDDLKVARLFNLGDSSIDQTLFPSGRVGFQLGTILNCMQFQNQGCDFFDVIATPTGKSNNTMMAEFFLAHSSHSRDPELLADFIHFLKRAENQLKIFRHWDTMLPCSKSGLHTIQRDADDPRARYLKKFISLTPRIAPVEYPASIKAHLHLSKLMHHIWIDLAHYKTIAKEVVREVDQIIEQTLAPERM